VENEWRYTAHRTDPKVRKTSTSVSKKSSAASYDQKKQKDRRNLWEKWEALGRKGLRK
jgi:hypothetical protein